MSELVDALKAEARALGFAEIGIARPEIGEAGERLRRWVAEGRHGEMGWMAERLAWRADPALAHAAIDISDGLIADLNHLCTQSGCGAVVDLDSLPMSAALRSLYPLEQAEQLMLHGGDDYELCFSAAPTDAKRVSDTAVRVGVPVTAIGELTSTGKIEGRRGGSSIELVPRGFVHFQ
jgi:thiamine monophosphate kinase